MNNSSQKKQKISEKELNILKEKYPNIPDDYTRYLKNIGFGTIGEIQFNVAQSLYDLADLGLEDIYTVPENIKFFGDNFSGDFVGFDISNKRDEVIELWHASDELYYTGKTFQEYIGEQLLLGEGIEGY